MLRHWPLFVALMVGAAFWVFGGTVLYADSANESSSETKVEKRLEVLETKVDAIMEKQEEILHKLDNLKIWARRS